MSGLEDLEISRITPCFYPYVSGPAKQIHNISYGLLKKGIRSPIYTSNYRANKSPDFEIMNGIQVRRFPVFLKRIPYIITPKLIPELLKRKPAIIHVHGYRNFHADIAYMISRIKNIPFVINSHGTALMYKIIIKNRYLRLPYVFYDFLTFKRALKDADCVIASTTQEFNELVQFGVKKDRLRIIPAGINLKKYDDVKYSKKDDFNILFVGRITQDRNLELLLEAFNLVHLKNKKVSLTIVGGEEKRTFTSKSGYIDLIKKKSETLNISKKTEFLGPLYGKDLIKTFKSADVFVYTSLYENFGQTILEAAAAGLPIISTPVGVANDLIVDGHSGFLASFNNPKDLSTKISDLLLDQNLRSKFTKNTRRMIEEKYQWKNIIEEYVNIYKNLLN